TYQFSDSVNGFVSYKQSFRVPQESNLFRQGANLNALELKPVVADSVEAGLRGRIGPRVMWDLSVYEMETSDDILTRSEERRVGKEGRGRTSAQCCKQRDRCAWPRQN